MDASRRRIRRLAQLQEQRFHIVLLRSGMNQQARGAES
jgi:hypothetical protein